MRQIIAAVLLSCLGFCQSPPAGSATSAAQQEAKPGEAREAGDILTIPTGSRIPVALQHAISTKSAREGDSVYAQTTFPFVVNDRVLVPAGTYIQGRITSVKRGGRLHGRAELLMHFTTLIYPSGYTVVLPGSVENVPGADKTSMKDKEGTIRQESEKGDKAIKVARNAGYGGVTGGALGGISTGSRTGAAIGAGAGGAAGAAIALLSRGSDVRLEQGTTIEMEVQRPITLDASRISKTTR
jgi:type IV secretion system protein VirB10